MGQKNAAGADDNSTGGRVSKASRQAWGGGGGKGAGGLLFSILLGTGGDWATGDESATKAR